MIKGACNGAVSLYWGYECIITSLTSRPPPCPLITHAVICQLCFADNISQPERVHPVSTTGLRCHSSKNQLHEDRNSNVTDDNRSYKHIIIVQALSLTVPCRVKNKFLFLANFHSHHQTVYNKEHNDHTLQLIIPYRDYYHCVIANIKFCPVLIPVYI